jgi:hypothetical protein
LSPIMGEPRDPDDRILRGQAHTLWGNVTGSCAQRGECPHWITTRSAFAVLAHFANRLPPQTLGRLADRPIIWGRKPLSVSTAHPAAGVLWTIYGLVAGMTGTHCTPTEIGTAAGAWRSKRMPRPPSNRGEGRGPLRARPRAWGVLDGGALKLFDRPLGRPLFGRCAVSLPRSRRLRDGTVLSPLLDNAGQERRAGARGTPVKPRTLPSIARNNKRPSTGAIGSPPVEAPRGRARRRVGLSIELGWGIVFSGRRRALNGPSGECVDPGPYPRH